MEKDSSVFFRDLKEDIKSYAELKLEYYKLGAYESGSKVGGQLSYGLVLIVGALLALLFILLSIGFFLGDLFHSFGLGFLCVAVILAITCWIIKISKDKLSDKFMNMIISWMISKEDNKENGTDNSEINTPDSSGEITLHEGSDRSGE